MYLLGILGPTLKAGIKKLEHHIPSEKCGHLHVYSGKVLFQKFKGVPVPDEHSSNKYGKKGILISNF